MTVQVRDTDETAPPAPPKSGSVRSRRAAAPARPRTATAMWWTALATAALAATRAGGTSELLEALARRVTATSPFA